MLEPEGRQALTRREKGVLGLAALGMSNRQIATQLAIAEQTVKNHLWNATQKLALHDRTQAVVMALREGWIPMPVGEDPARSPAGLTETAGGDLTSSARSLDTDSASR